MKQIQVFLIGLWVFLACETTQTRQENTPDSTQNLVYRPPTAVYGQLLYDVQFANIYEDGKTFVDCIPKIDPDSIRGSYESTKNRDDFDLKTFVGTYFDPPYTPQNTAEQLHDAPIVAHIDQLWKVLRRPADSTRYGSRINLKKNYVVPGGRFREIYYWDSYFTMLGLEVSGEHQMIEDMVGNFADMIDQFGFIPNGSRTYYLGRSQPPFFAMMVDLLAGIKGDQVWEAYLPYLEKEYAFWMEGTEDLNVNTTTAKRTVLLDSKYVLNRYWDNFDGPREESLAEDVSLVRESGREESAMYRHLRAGAESGWDYSSRWFADSQNLNTIETTNIIPVDLNALLYNLEQTIAKGSAHTGQIAMAAEYEGKAQIRKETINQYCWNEETGFYSDYNLKSKTITSVPSLAGMYPLTFQLASNQQAKRAAEFVEKNFLKPGGLMSTLNSTGQQWDAPNGWPPLQWMSFVGLQNYQEDTLAHEAASRWTALNEKVYNRTGKMMEKYNVEDIELEGGGGEYPLQDGFGWTNGVYLRLKSELAKIEKQR